jgi:uncharacterized membrane protein YdjX (TVP38/TMEM64 family)
MAHVLSGSIGGSRGGVKSRGPWTKGVLVIVGLAVLALIAWTIWDRHLIARWKETASPLPFFVGMAIAPAFGVPIGPLFVLAGATFGRRVGLIGSFVALAANLALCYWIARSALRPWLVRLLQRFHYQLPDFEKKYRGSWRFTLMVKVAPGIPQFVKNYGLGVAGVPFLLYFGVSMLLGGAYAVALNVLGESLFRHESARSVVIAAAVVVLALGAWWWRRKRSSRTSAPND